jgi:hypothetical protein
MVGTGDGRTTLKESNSADLIIVDHMVATSSLLLGRWGLVVQEKAVCTGQIGGVVVLPTREIVLEFPPETAISFAVSSLQKANCDRLLLRSGHSSFVVLFCAQTSWRLCHNLRFD